MIDTAAAMVVGSSEQRLAVSYVRVSSDEQEKEGFSLPAQRALIREYAARHGMRLLQEYEDVETAKRAGRTAFGEMVTALKRHRRCRTILVEKLDRLTRNFRDLVTLEELGVEIHFIKENQVYAPTSRSSDKLMVGFRTLIAKNYIDNLSEETRKGQREKAAQGLWPSCAPLGYVNVTLADGRRVIDPDPVRGPLITKLFETYATGRYSLKELATVADELELRSRKGHRLARAAVHYLLRSRIYTGQFDWDGTTYRGTHPPLVSHELWSLVQDILQGRAVTRRRRARHDFAFSRVMTCGHCGCALVGDRKKQKYTYYRCSGYRGKCPEPYTREEVLEERFTTLLRGLSFDEEVMAWVADALKQRCDDERRDNQEVISRARAEYSRLDKRLEVMYVDRLDGRVDAEFFDRRAREWRHEQERLRAVIDQHRGPDRTSLETGVRLLDLVRRAPELFERQESQEKRRLLNFLLSNCTWKDGALHAKFRQPFDMLAVTATATRKDMVRLGSVEAISKNWLLRLDSNQQPSG